MNLSIYQPRFKGAGSDPPPPPTNYESVLITYLTRARFTPLWKLVHQISSEMPYMLKFEDPMARKISEIPSNFRIPWVKGNRWSYLAHSRLHYRGMLNWSNSTMNHHQASRHCSCRLWFFSLVVKTHFTPKSFVKYYLPYCCEYRQQSLRQTDS